MEKYIYKDGKNMRYGYTTGSCATAAAKGAARMLVYQKKIETVRISTLKGWDLDLELEDRIFTKNFAQCSVKKDSGDDPDSTNGINIFAKVERIKKQGIEITGGEGIGMVTKRGLSIEPGNYAINPIPRESIKKAVEEELPKKWGVKVTIFCPQGVEIAKKTFNPQLGIQGGISILGTTGIIEPMSEEAFKDSLAIEISIKKAEGIKQLIFSPGNYGNDFSKSMGLDSKYLIKTSNFIGFMLDKAEEFQIEKILWIGHIGKMVKIAGGIFHTHSYMADARMEILAAYAALLKAPYSLVQKILSSMTTEEAIEFIKDWEKEREFFNLIAQKVSDRCRKRIKSPIQLGTILFSQKYGFLGQCRDAEKLLEGFKIE
ncbi:cobalt-precorrin-5B (C(1))-methyltransferase CbiD [Garciella nitratireducens]|uniref:Cobalt-precorrin-5B C(1)-methyltransferase n=1 Tax=Garciella nitratireducens DSM 15102 TaxID=1121911 RepID=A0A1T4KII8_9FIRM|nr:cobalt-precorrin-5B (C(1))-methyltransferase CbiD [Garciella nitratireducens]RBP41557.1 cobalt-precorrin 5B C1-methyltransferase [Garciella nitratireducens]SJZ42173.1 cobalt-precorrin 5B C1-methyltransferase [Garciella nitratireducens DSM 15102]